MSARSIELQSTMLKSDEVFIEEQKKVQKMTITYTRLQLELSLCQKNQKLCTSQAEVGNNCRHVDELSTQLLAQSFIKINLNLYDVKYARYCNL